MYNDLFSIGPISVHSYGVCIAVGLLAALWVLVKRAKQRNLNEDICYGILFCGAIFGFLGAKIMFILVEWQSFIADPVHFISSSGFVVFGGITGGVLSVFVYCKIKKVDFLTYIDLAIPSVALAQGFGRLGCFMAGCCYGRETDSWIGIAFKNSDYAPNGVKLIPTQLMSAVGDWILVIILITVAAKVTRKGFTVGLYLILYSIGRFIVEIFRDDARGSVGALSTSQFYGIFALIIGIAVVILSFKLGKKNPVEETAAATETVETAQKAETEAAKETEEQS